MVIVDRIRGLLPSGAFGRGVATIALGTGLAQVLVIAMSPVLTRLYDPQAYGTFAVAMSIIAVLITITCLRYERAIPLPVDETSAANLVALSVMVNVVLSLTAGVVLLVAGSAAFDALGAPALAPWALLVPLSQFAGGLSSTFSGLTVRAKRYPDIARARFSQAVALVTVQVMLGLVSAGALGLLVGDVAGRLSGAAQLARSAWRRQSMALRTISFAGITAEARRYRRFPIYSSGSSLLATVGVQAPLVLLVAFYGPQAGGIYALSARICAIPLALITDSVSHVFQAESAHLARTDPTGVRPLVARTTRAMARMAIGPAVVAMIAAPILAGPIFGAEWAEAGLFIAILVPAYFMEFVIGSTGDVLFVLERQDLHLVREIMRFTILSLAIPFAAWLGLETIGAIVVLSLAGILNYTIYGLITWWVVRQYHGGVAGAAAHGADPTSEDSGVPSGGEPW